MGDFWFWNSCDTSRYPDFCLWITYSHGFLFPEKQGFMSSVGHARTENMPNLLNVYEE